MEFSQGAVVFREPNISSSPLVPTRSLDLVRQYLLSERRGISREASWKSVQNIDAMRNSTDSVSEVMKLMFMLGEYRYRKKQSHP